jgi:SAM-dependent methyltransferase
MKLRKKLPSSRTLQQIQNHYEVEKGLALRLKQASREERKALYPSLYNELFARVPDHPRLSARISPAAIESMNRRKFKLLERFIGPDSVVAEFAPGDCNFARHLAARVRKVLAIDISDQAIGAGAPSNFRLVLYNGYDLDLPERCADIAFSDDFIEHLHPDDARLHAETVHRILRNRGVYVLRTPHAYFGPHDISEFFSDTPEGFHLKEWTFGELARLLCGCGFARVQAYHKIDTHLVALPLPYFLCAEILLKTIPRGNMRRALSRLFLPRKIVMNAFKSGN